MKVALTSFTANEFSCRTFFPLLRSATETREGDDLSFVSLFSLIEEKSENRIHCACSTTKTWDRVKAVQPPDVAFLHTSFEKRKEKG